MDIVATKMLSIHVDALLPPTSAELDLPHSAQVAALLGVGLLYQGTGHRRMAEVLLSEIGERYCSLEANGKKQLPTIVTTVLKKFCIS